MAELAYISGGSHFQAKHWLRGLAADAEVVLLTSPVGLNEAQELKECFASVTDILELSDDAPSADIVQRVASLGVTEITLPISLESRSYECSRENNLPDITPLYPLFRQLWQLGFRAFNIHNAGGAFSVKIPHFLDDFKGRHKGERCFVVGNGPSLNNIDMGRLNGEITLGSNRCYLGYESWGYNFTYWGIADTLQIEEYGHEYEDNVPIDTPKFMPFSYLPILGMENTCPILFDEVISKRYFQLGEPLYPGHSVTYMLMQIAALMGCDPIILVGVDHNYSLNESWLSSHGRQFRENLVRPIRGSFPYHVVRSWRERKKRDKPLFDVSEMKYWEAGDTDKPTHFNDAYTGGPKKMFKMPMPAEAHKDYVCAKQWADNVGIHILNATPDSALDVFDKVSFDELF